MTGKQAKRIKHVPQRTCVGCHTVLPKQSLYRRVRLAEDHVQLDPTGKLAGRGAYLHKNRTCWEKGLKGSLSHALKVNFTPDDLASLQQFMQALPADVDEEKQPMDS